MESYSIRDGVIDYGKDYEVKMSALLSLRCAAMRGVCDSWVVLNADRCGAFDDLVVCVKLSSGATITYLLQLKHGLKRSDIAAREFKTKRNGDFLLAKYYQTVIEIETCIGDEQDVKTEIINHLRSHHDSIVYLLYTNRDTTEDCGEFLINVNKKSEIDSKWLLYQLIDTGGSVFRFNYNKVNLNIDDNLKNAMEENFFLFAKQIHIDKIDDAIANALANLIKPLQFEKHVLANIVHGLNMTFLNWSKGELGGHFPLTKQDVLSIVLDLVISPYIMNVEGRLVDIENLDLFKNIIRDNPMVISEEDDTVGEFLNSFVAREIQTYCENLTNCNLWKKHPEKISREILRSAIKAKKIRSHDAYECLWKSGQAPLIVRPLSLQHLTDLLHLLKICGYNYPVIVLHNFANLNLHDAPGLFRCAQDLNQENLNAVLRCPIELQGRRFVSLENFKLDYEKLKLITAKDVIHILSQKFNIGNKFEPLPDIFMERFLEKVWLDASMLQKLPEESFLIKCHSMRDYENFVRERDLVFDNGRIFCWKEATGTNIQRGTITIIEGDLDVEQIEAFVAKTPLPVHLLILHHNNLEWIKSYGSVKNILGCRMIPKHPQSLKYTSLPEILSREIDNNVNIISACPGMGKSLILDYIESHVSTEWWVLKVNLLDLSEYYGSKSCNEAHSQPSLHLMYILDILLSKFGCSSNLARVIFEKYLSRRKVLILFDGFDEIPLNLQAGAEDMIKSISQDNHWMFLTTRPFYRNHLEELLNTLAVSMVPFTMQNQLEFLTTYYSELPKSSLEVVNGFVKELLGAAKSNFNDQEFTGVPLQTKMFAEAFEEDFNEFVVTGRFENKHFDLLYLYKHFVEQKIKIYCSKFGSGSQDILDHYKNYRSLCALQYLFAKEDLVALDVEKQIEQVGRIFPNSLQLMQKDGIVLAQTTSSVAFVHRTFAEYLAAHWLTENFKGEYHEVCKGLAKRIFHQNFSVTRSIFDHILAQNCPLHLAIIKRRLDTVKELINANNNFEQLDKGDRSFLHLIAAWGVYHPENVSDEYQINVLKRDVDEDRMAKILNLIGTEKLHNGLDGIFGYTPLDYAILSGSTGIANSICIRQNDAKISIIYEDITIRHTTSSLENFQYFSLSNIVMKCRYLKQTNMFLRLLNMLQRWPGSYLYRVTAAGKMRNLDLLICNERNIDTIDDFGQTMLHAAVLSGNGILASLLLERGADPNRKDQSGDRPLHLAVLKGHVNIVYLLLSKNANVDGTNDSGSTALHTAAAVAKNNDRNEIVSALLEGGANIFIRDNGRQTALELAVYFRQAGVLKAMLSSRAEYVLSHRDSTGATILHWVARNGFADVLAVLLSYGGDPNLKDSFGRTVLHCAAEAGHADVIEVLFSGNIKPDIEARNNINARPLHIAAWEGRTSVATLLVTKGAYLEAKDDFYRTPLLCATHNGHESTVHALLNLGADLEARGERDRTPLLAASRGGYTNLVKCFLAKNANIEATNDEGLSALKFAASQGHEDIVKILLSNGAKFDQTDISGKSPLIWAAMGGFDTIVDLLLSTGINIAQQDKEGMCALQWAAYNGHTRVIELLLQRGANVDVKDNTGNSLVALASYNGYFKTVSLLISKGADIESKNLEGLASLHMAALNGHSKVVQLLVSHGANVTIVSNVGYIPLMLACHNGHTNIVKLLLSSEDDLQIVDNEGMTALHWAALHGRTSTVQYLFSKGAKLQVVNNYGKCPLLCAATNGHSDTVQFLLSVGSNIEANDDLGMTALHSAAEGGHIDTIKVLLSFGADMEKVDYEGNAPLHFAAFEGHSTVVKIMLDAGVNINAQDPLGMSALHWSLHKNRFDVAEILFNSNADVELKTEQDETPLIFFAEKGNVEAVRQLISRGANVEAVDAEGKRPLHYAAVRGHRDIVELLLCNGAGIEAKCIYGKTPLIYATCFNNLDVINVLLNKKANIEAKDKNQNTSLIYAARYGFIEVVKVFLSNDASLDSKNNENATALHWAILNDHQEVVKFLVEKGANLEARTLDGKTPLMCAVQKGSRFTIELLLTRSVDLHALDNQQRTALHWSVLERQVPTMELLLDKGLIADTTDSNGRTALMYSAIEGFLDAADILIRRGVCLELADKENMTALLWAAHKGQSDVLQLLISKEADLFMKNVNGKTALICASMNGHVNAVKILLKKQIGKEETDNVGRNALHWACWEDYYDVAEVLLASDVLLDEPDISGDTALMLATKKGNLGIVGLLLEKGANANAKNNDGATPLICASCNGYNEVADLLLSKGADVEASNKCGKTALIYSSEKGHHSIVVLLISRKANLRAVDQTGRDALLWALNNAQEEIANLLITNGADINVKDDYQMGAVHYAVISDCYETLKLLLSKGANFDEPDNMGCTPVICAVVSDLPHLVDLLLFEGVNAEVKVGPGSTLLHLAVVGRKVDVVQSLLSHNVDVESKDNSGCCALIHASYHGVVSAAKMLLAYGANVEAADNDGNTALLRAAWNGQLEVVDLLLEHGADASVTNNRGQNALILAAHNGHEAIVRTLLLQDLKLNVKDKEGLTAMDWAEKNNHGEIVSLLKSKSTSLKDNCAIC